MPKDYSYLGKKVPVEQVDKELRMLWEIDDEATKASLMNFVIYSEGSDSLKANAEAIGKITQEHACRAIIMDLDRDGPKPNVHAWITAHCNLSGGKKAVCCEQVAFKLDGYTPGIVRHTLFSHLESDLPLVLWWQGDFSESFRESFHASVNRLLFDSGEWVEPVTQFKKLSLALEESPTLIIQDLAWTRTYQFRIALAALVDQPIVMKRLAQVQAIHVKSSQRTRTSALQLLAWFTSLSSYQPSPDLIETKGDAFTMLKPEGGEVNITTEYSAAYSSLCEIEINMGDCILRVSKEEDRPLLLQQVILNGESIVNRHCPADRDDPVSLISSQLSRGGKNSLFRKVLPTFLELL